MSINEAHAADGQTTVRKEHVYSGPCRQHWYLLATAAAA